MDLYIIIMIILNNQEYYQLTAPTSLQRFTLQ